MILYLTHDITDTTTRKRVRMLLAGGAKVRIAGFTREDAPSEIEGCPVTVLGRTSSGNFRQRIGAVLSAIATLHRHRALFRDVTTILARNLEMLAIARYAIILHPARIAYEVLDIHRLLLRNDLIGMALRTLEAHLARSAALIVTSSPAFIRDYFETSTSIKLPMLLVENKVFGVAPTTPVTRPAGPPWRIGWFGALRCAKSLAILSEVARANPGLVEIVLRGHPSYAQLPDFDTTVKSTPGVAYLGPYTNPDELAAIYTNVHFSWAIDMYEENLNSSWLLPNRIYEGCLHGAIPLAASDVETSRFIANLGIGRILAEPKITTLTNFLKNLTPESYSKLASDVNALPQTLWLASTEECRTLVTQLNELTVTPAKAGAYAMEGRLSSAWIPVVTGMTASVDGTQLPPLPTMPPILVIVPCLNEAAHIESIMLQLASESAHLSMRIIIVDGGSTDGTVELIHQWAEKHPAITYLHNPKSIQAAAINLAVAEHAGDAEFLIRIDAHGHFPADYCRQLVHEAIRTGADSVTVAMTTTGKGGFQDAVAAAQNSVLGNGGASHRSGIREGSWVDHAHHALMRIAPFRTVGGYDETFTHNEDAELDTRLKKMGFRIWLTAKTTHRYYPRASVHALFRQYRHYGMGRVRNLLKHRSQPRMRQLLPVAVLPAIALLILAPFMWLAAVPFVLWASLCITYGVVIAWQAQKPHLALTGPAAMIMHSGWSLGFWQGLHRYGKLRA